MDAATTVVQQLFPADSFTVTKFSDIPVLPPPDGGWDYSSILSAADKISRSKETVRELHASLVTTTLEAMARERTGVLDILLGLQLPSLYEDYPEASSDKLGHLLEHSVSARATAVQAGVIISKFIDDPLIRGVGSGSRGGAAAGGESSRIVDHSIISRSPHLDAPSGALAATFSFPHSGRLAALLHGTGHIARPGHFMHAALDAFFRTTDQNSITHKGFCSALQACSFTPFVLPEPMEAELSSEECFPTAPTPSLMSLQCDSVQLLFIALSAVATAPLPLLKATSVPEAVYATKVYQVYRPAVVDDIAAKYSATIYRAWSAAASALSDLMPKIIAQVAALGFDGAIIQLHRQHADAFSPSELILGSIGEAILTKVHSKAAARSFRTFDGGSSGARAYAALLQLQFAAWTLGNYMLPAAADLRISAFRFETLLGLFLHTGILNTLTPGHTLDRLRDTHGAALRLAPTSASLAGAGKRGRLHPTSIAETCPVQQVA